MADLTPRQRSELRALASGGKLWGGVPPHSADANLAYYIRKGFVSWEGDGYRITDAGRIALRPSHPTGEAHG